MEIRYDIADWEQAYDTSQARPTNMDEAIDLMRESDIKLSELALLLIVGRERGDVQDERMPTNKLSNLIGLARHVGSYRSRQKARVNIAGKDVDVPRFVSTATIEEGEQGDYQFAVPSLNSDSTIVDYDTQEASERAISYLMTNVVGRIRERLSLIALNSPAQLNKVADELKSAIDEIVDDLT